MSAMLRPATTAMPEIGSERKRSVMPLSASTATSCMVAPMPKAVNCANRPGIRNSM